VWQSTDDLEGLLGPGAVAAGAIETSQPGVERLDLGITQIGVLT